MSDLSWRKLKGDESSKSVEESIEPEVVIDSKKRRIVDDFVKVGDFSICYVQPDPLPSFVEMFQKLRHKDVDFVKIPVNSKEDKLYLRPAISKLLTRTGIHWDKVKDLINEYNSDEEAAKKERANTREVLLNLVNLSIYFCEKEGVEFLRETLN